MRNASQCFAMLLNASQYCAGRRDMNNTFFEYSGNADISRWTTCVLYYDCIVASASSLVQCVLLRPHINPTPACALSCLQPTDTIWFARIPLLLFATCGSSDQDLWHVTHRRMWVRMQPTQRYATTLPLPTYPTMTRPLLAAAHP